jgi:hypothetical protein
MTNRTERHPDEPLRGMAGDGREGMTKEVRAS